MDTKLIAGILLIVGSAIAGGMLALPVALSELGFVYSSLLLVLCWFVMTSGALLILEVNSWLPRNNNIISMSQATLGGAGQAVAWVTYLFLLYTLIAAYVAGGGDFLWHLCTALHIPVSKHLACILFTVVLGTIVYAGIQSVDYMNRGLMIAKLGGYVLLVCLIVPHTSLHQLSGGNPYRLGGMTVAITSFGFAQIIPSLRAYFNDDKKKVRKAIWIGSLIPLVCYILWNISIMGIIGNDQLISMLKSGQSTAEFVERLNQLLQNNIITTTARVFTSICLATGFLGVALGLSDFLADGFSLERTRKNNTLIIITALSPPLAVALFYPGLFVKALGLAGIDCVILLILLPVLMVWSGRYRKKIASGYQVFGGKGLLVFLMLFSVVALSLSFLQ